MKKVLALLVLFCVAVTALDAATLKLVVTAQQPAAPAQK